MGEHEPIMVQEYLPIVKKGDKRIILINGEPVGCLNRIPAEGEFRSNLGVGGLPELSNYHQGILRFVKELVKH